MPATAAIMCLGRIVFATVGGALGAAVQHPAVAAHKQERATILLRTMAGRIAQGPVPSHATRVHVMCLAVGDALRTMVLAPRACVLKTGLRMKKAAVIRPFAGSVIRLVRSFETIHPGTQ